MILTAQQQSDRIIARQAMEIVQRYFTALVEKKQIEQVVTTNKLAGFGIKLNFGAEFDISNIPDAFPEFNGLLVVLNFSTPATLVKSAYVPPTKNVPPIILLNFMEIQKLRRGNDRHELEDFLEQSLMPTQSNLKAKRSGAQMSVDPWIKFLSTRGDAVYRCIKSSFRREYVRHLEFLRGELI
jgi:hypothetical protein